MAKFYNAYLALISAIDHDAVLSEPDWTRYVSDLGKIVGKPWDAYAEEPKSTKENPQIEIRANLKRWKTLLIKECLRVHDLSVFYKLGWRVALALCKCLDPDTDDLTLRMFGTLLLKDDFNVSSDYTNGIIKIARIGAHDEFDDWFASFYGDSFREFQRRQEDDRRERAKRQ